MSLRRRVSCLSMLLATLLLSAVFAPSSAAQQPTGAWKALTVERIYSQPSLSGRLTRGLAWTLDGKQLSYFETKGEGKDAKTELWVMDAASGERRLVVAADKLESILPVDTSRPTQATGLGRRAPSQYQWAPDGAGILFQGPTALAWLEVNSQSGRTLVSGKATLADPKISPDGRFVSFVRDHNLWLVNLATGAERAITQGGTEEIRKGELDWVYPEELDIKTAYWWAPDSSAIAYLEMDERKVSQYPMVDFSSPSGEAEMERYPTAGGANPILRVLVASLSGAEPRAMDIGTETDIYIPRVNWLTDSKHVAIQRLNRTQTKLDLLIADTTTGKTRTALSEHDANWINVSDDLYFLKDGKRFLWSSEHSVYRHLYLHDLEANSSRSSPRASGKALRSMRSTKQRVLSISPRRKNLLGNGTSTAWPSTGPASPGSPRKKARTLLFLRPMLPHSTRPIRTTRHLRARISAAPMDRASPRLTKTKSPSLRTTISLPWNLSRSNREMACNSTPASSSHPTSIRRRNIPCWSTPMEGRTLRSFETPGVARIFSGTSSWCRRATLFFQLIIAVRPVAAMRSRRRCTSAWARRNFPTSATGYNTSNRCRTSIRNASGSGDGATAAI